jgi:hypothetical protein
MCCAGTTWFISPFSFPLVEKSHAFIALDEFLFVFPSSGLWGNKN